MLYRFWLLLLLCAMPAAGQVTAILPNGPAQPPVADWQAVLDGLRQELAALAALPTQADVRDSNLPLAALQLDKIEARLASDWPAEAEQQAARAAFQAASERLRNGVVAHRGETGEGPLGYLERAYLCRTDGSAQPYYVRLPKGYDARKKYPLVLFLHGYVPEISKAEPWVVSPSQWQLAADRGVILAMPYGRRNSDFLGIGEVDTLRVLEEIQRWYSVDAARVILSGCSMGGYGAWAVGLRHPDLFAGLGIMSGQTDFFLWERRDPAETAFKSWLIRQNNPLDLAGNARHLPVYLQHGELDHLVSVEHSRRMVAELKRLGYAVRYQELPGESHFIYWDDPPFQRLFDWAKAVKPRAVPRQITFRTFTPRQGRAYWLDVRGLQQWGPAATVEARLDRDKLTLKTANVAELWLDLPRSLVAKSATVEVNGAAAGSLKAGPHRLSIAADGRPAGLSPATPPLTRPRVGPAREVFNSPFLLVLGTGGSAADRYRNLANAGRLFTVWRAFADAKPALVREDALTAEQAATHNLLILGEPGTVTLPGLADPATTLPAGVSMAPGVYRLGDKEWRGDDYGMLCLVPHPLHADRLILWWSGAEYGRGLPINHQFDLLPDVLVYDGKLTWDGANRFLAGGFFDHGEPGWRLDPTRLDTVAPAPTPYDF